MRSIEDEPCGEGDGCYGSGGGGGERAREFEAVAARLGAAGQTRERKLERGKHQVLFSSGGYMGRAGLSAISVQSFSFSYFVLYHTQLRLQFSQKKKKAPVSTKKLESGFIGNRILYFLRFKL